MLIDRLRLSTEHTRDDLKSWRDFHFVLCENTDHEELELYQHAHAELRKQAAGLGLRLEPFKAGCAALIGRAYMLGIAVRNHFEAGHLLGIGTETETGDADGTAYEGLVANANVLLMQSLALVDSDPNVLDFVLQRLASKLAKPKASLEILLPMIDIRPDLADASYPVRHFVYAYELTRETHYGSALYETYRNHPSIKPEGGILRSKKT